MSVPAPAIAAAKRVERIGDATLLLGDCLDLMPHLGPVDAVVTDPPYGIGEASGKAKTRTSGLSEKVRHQYRRDYGTDSWDDKTADEAVALAVSIAKYSIVFGGNYYNVPPTSCWLIWDKLNGETDFADCEMAWTNLPKAVRRLRFLWNGCMRWERAIEREHPTQKPVGVMTWCIEKLPADCRTILDPFMGSGTTLVACAKLGRQGIGIEIDQKYFDVACRRVEEAYRQSDFFVSRPAPAVQELLFLDKPREAAE